MQFQYSLTKLENGVRIATCEMPHMHSVSAGIWAGVGGRHEGEPESGISHFIEHLLFKGTRHRSARRIIEAVEGIGGYLNTFTTEDHTCYYAKAGREHLEEICDVLCDMYLCSRLSNTDIQREREVIREEILMYRDHPAQHAQELLSATMWPKHPLGRPLTGSEETIGSFKRPQLLDFMHRNYNGATTVITVAGNVTHQEVIDLLKPKLRVLKNGKSPRFESCKVHDSEPRISLFSQETEQTHLAMGFYAFGRTDERRFALKLLSVILGENMSSRLFQKLREHHGFCYSVQSGMVILADSGLLNICAGLDPAKSRRAMRVIFQELGRLCRQAPSREELRRAQDFTIGQTLMGLESTTNQIMWMGESVLGYRKILDPAEIKRKVLAVTCGDVRRVACHCLNKARLGIAAVGPIKEAKEIHAWVA